MFAELVSIVAPIYIAIGIGYAWGRSGRRWDTELLTGLIMTIGAPCLVFSSLVGLEVERRALLEMVGATLVSFAGMGAVGWLALRAMGLPANTYLPPIIFANAGNMGLPVCLFAYGPEGLALGICYYAVAALTQYTVGLWIWSGEVSFGQLFRTPLTWSVALAALVLATDLPVPTWIERTTDLLGGFTIPLMQLSLGVSLSTLQIQAFPRTLVLSLLRLSIGVGIGFLVAELFELEGTARGVLILDCAMPVAVLNYLLAVRYQRESNEIASLVVFSTLISLVSLPLLLGFLL